MRILILHNAVDERASAEERDVLDQVVAVENALRTLEHSTERLACTLDLESLRLRLRSQRPDAVFNLVESLGGSDRLISLIPALLESLKIPFTGTPSLGLARTSDKISAKREMFAADLPTPAYFSPRTLAGASVMPFVNGQYIIKAIAEHASVGIDDRSIITAENESVLISACETWSDRTGLECFAELFIAGREFNIALLETAAGVRTLPPAEIDFSSFPADMPHLVGYRAKWDEHSFEYQNTPRRLCFSVEDKPLLKNLAELAEKCWWLFDLHGYARIDFRVDQHGQSWILEVNANPCLSPDAGFAAALVHEAIPLPQAIQGILAAAIKKTPLNKVNC